MRRTALDGKLYDWHFPAGPKAPAPVAHAKPTRAPFYNVPASVAAALKARNA